MTNDPDIPASNPADSTLDTDVEAIEDVLRKTRWSVIEPVVIEGVTWYLAVVSAVLASGLIVGLAVPEVVDPVVRGILYGGFGCASLAGLVAASALIRNAPTLREVAATLQRAAPEEFRSDIVAALQFAEELRTDNPHGFSRKMAALHVRRTAQALADAKDDDGGIASRLPAHAFRPALVVLGVGVALVCIVTLVGGDDATRTFRLALSGTPEEAALAKQAQPVIGDIDLKYTFPRYTGLPPRLVSFSSGHVEALIGTEVTVRTYPLFAARRYDLVMQTEHGTREIPLALQPDGRLEAKLVVTKPGSYSCRAILADGTEVSDGIARSIVVVADEAPRPSMTPHAVASGAAEIEVGPEDVLRIEYHVDDDFGVASVGWNYRLSGDQTPTRTELRNGDLAAHPKSVDGKFELDLAPLKLQPKDVVIVTFEAVDNNTLTGPGRTESAPLTLRVSSPDDKHERLLEEQAELVEKLLDVLAGWLENPVGARRATRSGEGYTYTQVVDVSESDTDRIGKLKAVKTVRESVPETLATMAKLVDRLREDPLMTPRNVEIFAGLYRELYNLDRDGEELLNRLSAVARGGRLPIPAAQRLADHVASEEAAYEKAVVRLKDLLGAEKMASVERYVDEIKAMKERLKELLEQYKESQDPELKAAIMREIQRLRQRLAALAAKLQSQMDKLPQDHMNLEALETSQMMDDAQDVHDGLSKVEELLAKGDIDGAMKALDELGNSLEDFENEMQQQFGQAQPESLSEFDQKMSELMDGVNDLIEHEQAVERSTSDLQEEARVKHQAEVERMLGRLTQKLRRQSQELLDKVKQVEKRSALSQHDRSNAERARRQLEELQNMLGEHDIEQSLGRARKALDEMRGLEFSMELSKRYTGEGTKKSKQMQQTMDDLEAMIPKGRKLIEELQKTIDDSGRLSPAEQVRLDELARRQAEVDQQAQGVSEAMKAMSEEFPMVQGELGPKLDAARKRMGEAESDLRGSKLQRALDNERSSLEVLRGMKEEMRRMLQKQREQNQDGRGQKQRNERVEIPDSDDGTEELRFRESVMDAMKEKRLEAYDSEIEKYYKSLMQ